MRSVSRWLIGFVGSPLGIFVLAGLDSTIFFSFPGGIDAAIILLSAGRYPSLPWYLVALMAVAGSMAGAALTFWTGVRIGEHGLDRYVAPKRLARIRRRMGRAGSLGLAALDLIPPPFPFTPFILAAGALDVDAARFFVTLAACRVLRFGGEALLADVYGQRVLSWARSAFVRDAAILLSAVAVTLTVLSIVKVVRVAWQSRSASGSG